MKNHPVNNDYVQNLQEGLINEAKQTVYQSEDKPENKSYLTKDVKLDKFPIKKKVDENATVKSDDDSYSGLSDNQGNPVRIGGNSSGVKGKKKLKLKLENAQAGYPEEGIEGGTVEAKKREYKKKVEDKKRERLAAAPALASIQKESYDIVDSRLSDEDAKIDQNVKTRGVKKVRGQKPVPMVNSAGETVGEQNSGTRPRSQDLNTRGRLNKSREGEGIIAKGKRFIKKKFS